MLDPITFLALAAVAVGGFGAGRFVANYTRPEAVKARAFAQAMDALKKIEAMKPDSVSLAAEVAREAAQVQAIRDETAKL